MEQVAKLKRTWNLAHSSKLFKRFLKIIDLIYIYQLAKLMSFGSKDIYQKCTFSHNTHHDVTYLVNHGMVENTKTWISCEWNRTFLRNKKTLYLCLIWHIFRSYQFAAEVTFNSIKKTSRLRKEINGLLSKRM